MFPSIDEGDIEIKCFIKNNKMILDFGKNLSWIGLNKEDLIIFINVFKEKLKELK